MLARLLLCCALLVLDPAGLNALGWLSLGGETCEQSCPDDDADGRCAPDCDDCTCCVHLRVAVASEGASTLLRRDHAALWDGGGRFLPTPEPEDIGHVPKRA